MQAMNSDAQAERQQNVQFAIKMAAIDDGKPTAFTQDLLKKSNRPFPFDRNNNGDYSFVKHDQPLFMRYVTMMSYVQLFVFYADCNISYKWLQSKHLGEIDYFL